MIEAKVLIREDKITLHNHKLGTFVSVDQLNGGKRRKYH